MTKPKYEPRHLAPRQHTAGRLVAPAAGVAALGVMALAPAASAAQPAGAAPASTMAATTSMAVAATTSTNDPLLIDPVPPTPTDIDPTPGTSDPVPDNPTPVDPGTSDPVPDNPDPQPTTDPDPEPTTDPTTKPDDGGTTNPGDTTNTGNGGNAGNTGNTGNGGKPLTPGTVVDPGATPVVNVDPTTQTAGAPAPKGHTWVVPTTSQTGHKRYVAVAGYQPGAQLAQTGASTQLALLGAAMTAAGAGLVAAARRGRHAA